MKERIFHHIVVVSLFLRYYVNSILRGQSEVNRSLEACNAYAKSVISKVQCGLTMAKLKSILGEPDIAEDKDYLIMIEYTWGTYLVEGFRRDGLVRYITNMKTNGERRTVCN